MFKESFYNFFSLQVARIGETLQKPDAFDNEESIHIIRVCLKKIKSILTYLERLKIPGLTVKQSFKKENILFNILGRLREIDKQYEQLSEYEHKLSSHINDFVEFLKKNEKKERKNLAGVDLVKINRNLRDIQQYILETIDMYDDAYLYDEAMLFINSEFEKIKSIKGELDKYQNWHFVRKCLKNNMYMMSIILDSHHNSEITQDSLTEIDKLQDSIGNWHDEIVAFEFLSTFIKEKKN